MTSLLGSLRHTAISNAHCQFFVDPRTHGLYNPSEFQYESTDLQNYENRDYFVDHSLARADRQSCIRKAITPHNPKVLDTVLIQRASISYDGMHIELVESVHAPNPLITFREDEHLGMQVLLHFTDHDLAFPLSELERAIEAAKEDVHKESFYD